MGQPGENVPIMKAEDIIYAEADRPVVGVPCYYPPQWRDERAIRMQALNMVASRPNASIKDSIALADEIARFVIEGTVSRLKVV